MGSLRRWRLVVRLQRRAADSDVTADPSAPSQRVTTSSTTTTIDMSGLEGEVSASGSVQTEDGPGPSSEADLKAAIPLQVVVHSEAPPPSYSEVKEEGGTG